jgi:tetratricopeptide (TPR) repeat protein
MVGSLTAAEEGQLAQTIEMFEVITQSQPQDYQSLEILKEAYAKLGRDSDVVQTSKRIAHAYVLMGQLSSAILEYESVLQRHPDDTEAQSALNEIESKANRLTEAPEQSPSRLSQAGPAKLTGQSKVSASGGRAAITETDDGRQMHIKLFVEGKVMNLTTFDACWPASEPTDPAGIADSFIQVVADKGFQPLEKSLRLLSDKARVGFLPLDKYDVDYELARKYPAELCRRWCILPFDRLSKSVLVATANPFNRRAIAELEALGQQRFLWYLAAPGDISRALKKAFR